MGLWVRGWGLGCSARRRGTTVLGIWPFVRVTKMFVLFNLGFGHSGLCINQESFARAANSAPRPCVKLTKSCSKQLEGDHTGVCGAEMWVGHFRCVSCAWHRRVESCPHSAPDELRASPALR